MVFPGSPVVKNLRAKARDKGDAGLIPGAWGEEGRGGGYGYSPWECKKLDTTEHVWNQEYTY